MPSCSTRKSASGDDDLRAAAPGRSLTPPTMRHGAHLLQETSGEQQQAEQPEGQEGSTATITTMFMAPLLGRASPKSSRSSRLSCMR